MRLVSLFRHGRQWAAPASTDTTPPVVRRENNSILRKSTDTTPPSGVAPSSPQPALLQVSKAKVDADA